jgi:hypothetical protein
MEQPQSRFHGKVRVQKGDTLIEINIFDDNQEKVYLEIQKAVAQFSPDIKPATAAQREIARAEQVAAARQAAPPAPAPKPVTQPPLDAGIPNCPACRTNKKVESRQFVDSDTGENMERFKCKGCGRWIGKAFTVEELPY